MKNFQCTFFLKIAVFFLALLAQNSHLLAQHKIDFLSFRANNGFIIPHSQDLKPISTTNPVGFHVEWSRLHLDKKYWDHCNCFYQLGVGFSHYNFRNPEVLGTANNLRFHFEPYLLRHNRLQLTLKSGIGISYLSRVYHEEQNPENIFFSRPLSFMMFTGLHLGYQVSAQYSISMDAIYNHISNGGVKQPNKGMNFPMFGVGIHYRPKDFDWPSHEPDNRFRGKTRFYTGIFGSLETARADSVFQDQTSYIKGIQFGAIHPLSYINAIGIGSEISYDGSYAIRRNRGEGMNPFIASLLVQHHLIIGNIMFNQQLGWYALHINENSSRKFFQRYALNYLFKNGFYLGASLKAYGHVAQNMDLQAGFIF
ncbi:MAG: acyloxyacyl hydrolase [Cyclobacteriaceae bacterium]|nr:acyloxyacyl hydrolase [Cyclobacteriaceae bacterium]